MLYVHIHRHYCISGVQIPCPQGTYGDSLGLSTAACSGLCDAGYYGISTANTLATCDAECSPGFYCLAGSVNPSATPCPAGRYGTGGSTTANCTGPCDDGAYVCGVGRASCPAAAPGCHSWLAALPHQILPRWFNITGSCWLCVGQLLLCQWQHSAYRSDHRILQHAVGRCGNCANWASGVRERVRSLPCNAGSCGSFRNLRRVAWLALRVGSYYCLGGIRTACPAGRYGNATQLSSSGCTGACKAGFYGAGDALTTEECDGACSAGFYCPEGSTSATSVPWYVRLACVDEQTCMTIGCVVRCATTVGMRVCTALLAHHLRSPPRSVPTRLEARLRPRASSHLPVRLATTASVA